MTGSLSNINMDMPSYGSLLKQIKINFWLIGIPYGQQKLTIRYWICLICLCLMIIAESAFIVSKINSVNFLEITQLAPCTCIGILSFLKMLAITLKRRKIFELSENLGRLYNILSVDSDNVPLMRSQMVILKKLVNYFFILNVALIAVYNFSAPVIIFFSYLKTGETSFVLSYQVLLPFEINSWIVWSLVFVFSSMCGFICVLYYTTTDVLYCVLTTNVCANFVTISNKTKQLNKNNTHLLKDIIRDHQNILRLSEDLDDIFTWPNLFNVLVGSVEICALGFNLTMGEIKQIPGCILFLSSVLLQILMMSVFGENIMTESTKIGDAAYTCKWYEMDKKTKRNLLILMIRSRKPAKLTAYKFSIISYNSFCKILSTSWTYFTILLTVYTSSETEHK